MTGAMPEEPDDGRPRPYTQAEMRAIERDPVRLRAYFWSIAARAQRRSTRLLEASRRTGIEHPTSNYRPAFEDGCEDVHEAGVMARFSKAIHDNIDLLVETTLVGEDGELVCASKSRAAREAAADAVPERAS